MVRHVRSGGVLVRDSVGVGKRLCRRLTNVGFGVQRVLYAVNYENIAPLTGAMNPPSSFFFWDYIARVVSKHKG